MKIPFLRERPAHTADSLATAHARFARAALAIYVAAAAVAVTMLLASLTEDRKYHEQQLRENLLLQTQVQAFFLGKEVDHLAGELVRLGLRSEVNLLDQNLAPEQSLLNLTHAKSAFFNVGLAILSVDGSVLWSEPQNFLAAGTSFAQQPWFGFVKLSAKVHVVPVEPDRVEDAVLYVVSPIVRNSEFTGALLGAIDLARGGEMDAVAGARKGFLTVLATRKGAVVYPPTPPRFAGEEPWKRLFNRPSWEPVLTGALLAEVDTVVAATGVPDTDLVLLSLERRDDLLAEAQVRMVTRILLTLSIVLIPLVVLVLLLRRSLRVLREAERLAMREDRLRLIGEAANLIAHEVKNSLNNFRMGLDLLLRGARSPREASEEKIVSGLRKQIERMSDFTSELLIFSKGVSPRPVRIELREFVRKVTELAGSSAAELGVALDVASRDGAVHVHADPSLTHVILSNLVGNAIDAVSGKGAMQPPRIGVEVGDSGSFGWVRISDNGPGVGELIKPSLFEPFVSGKPSGVGIGLALSRKIARAHGGDLILEASGGGASFLLTLPRERT